MNIILFPTRADRYQLAARDPRLEHVRGVLRLGAGDQFAIGVVDGPTGKATILRCDRDELEIAAVWGEEPPALPPVRLLVGLPRPATARKVLTEATSLGVARIDFFAAARSDPAYARSSLWRDDAWRSACILGAEQACTTRLPEVQCHAALAAALAATAPGATRIALDVYEGTRRLAPCARIAVPVAIAFGPERGWTAPERRQLRAAGFTLQHLGPRVLRLETAVTAALALVHAAMTDD